MMTISCACNSGMDVAILLSKQPMRNYAFNYHYAFYSRLIEIKEFNGLGQRNNSTVFEYFENPITFSSLEINPLNTTDYNYVFSDYTGDGKIDYVRFPKEIGPLDNIWELYENQGNAQFQLISSDKLVDEFIIMFDFQATLKNASIATSKKFDGIWYKYVSPVGNNFDFNGDGCADLLWVETLTNSTGLRRSPFLHCPSPKAMPAPACWHIYWSASLLIICHSTVRFRFSSASS